VGTHTRIAAIEGDREMTRRLLSLGLRVGAEVDVLQRRGRSVVVANGAGTRVALGASIAEKVLCRRDPVV
jgi:ferrous iron transport protein A